MSALVRTESKTLAERTVAEAMHPGVLTCRPDTTLLRVAELFATYGVHAVVVYGSSEPGGKSGPWGVISALDLVAAALVRDVEEQTAAGSAATAMLMIRSDETLERAAQLLTEHGVSHLVVVDADTNHPVGVLSTLDIAGALSGVRVRSGPPRGTIREPW